MGAKPSRMPRAVVETAKADELVRKVVTAHLKGVKFQEIEFDPNRDGTVVINVSLPSGARRTFIDNGGSDLIVV